VSLPFGDVDSITFSVEDRIRANSGPAHSNAMRDTVCNAQLQIAVMLDSQG